MIDFIGFAIIVALIVLFAYLVKRAWGSKNKILKWVGVIGAGLLTLLCVAVLVMAVMGTSKLNTNLNATNPVSNVAVNATPEQLEFGKKYTEFCGCHSVLGQPPLNGSNFAQDAGFGFVGTLYAPNLTPSGEIHDWTDGEVIRAIREGVHKNGRSLIVMPAQDFHNMSDQDVQGIVAYLRTLPPAATDTPRPALNVLGAAVLGLMGGFTNQPPITQPIPKPAAGVTLEYGQYLVTIMGCRACHGEKLTGGTAFDGSPAPNLTLVIPQWTEEQFLTAIHTGALPGGTQLDNNKMPYELFSGFLTDEDLKALYLYLHGLTPSQ